MTGAHFESVFDPYKMDRPRCANCGEPVAYTRVGNPQHYNKPIECSVCGASTLFKEGPQ